MFSRFLFCWNLAKEFTVARKLDSGQIPLIKHRNLGIGKILHLICIIWKFIVKLSVCYGTSVCRIFSWGLQNKKDSEYKRTWSWKFLIFLKYNSNEPTNIGPYFCFQKLSYFFFVVSLLERILIILHAYFIYFITITIPFCVHFFVQKDEKKKKEKEEKEKKNCYAILAIIIIQVVVIWRF